MGPIFQFVDVARVREEQIVALNCWQLLGRRDVKKLYFEGTTTGLQYSCYARRGTIVLMMAELREQYLL